MLDVCQQVLPILHGAYSLVFSISIFFLLWINFHRSVGVLVSQYSGFLVVNGHNC